MTTASLHQSQPDIAVLVDDSGFADGSGFADVGLELPLEVIAMDSITNRLVGFELEIRRLEARRVEVFAEAFDLAALSSRAFVAGKDMPVDSSVPEGTEAELKYRAIRAELAAALRLSESTIERRMVGAWELTHCYWSVFDAYRDGEISEQHVHAILDAGRTVGLASDTDTSMRRAEYASRVLEYALGTSPNRLRPIARQIAEQYAETPLDERHTVARRRRSVRLTEAEDGMADLLAHLPAAEAYAIHDRLVRMGKVVAEGEAEAAADAEAASESEFRPRRRRDEIRADLFSDLLLGRTPCGDAACGDASFGDTGITAIRGQVQLLVPGEALFTGEPFGAAGGSDDEAQPLLGSPTAPLAPTMNGYGPIDSETTRRISGGAEIWETVHLDSASHAVLAVDRYRPSEQMRRLLRARDQHCRFPGCRAPLSRCDIDHTVDAAKGGATATDNLAHLCRGHHTLKHATGWKVKQLAGGVLDWRSPTGRGYLEPPPSKVRFVPAVSGEAFRESAHPF